MTYFPSEEVLIAEGKKTGSEYFSPHILTEFGGGADMKIYVSDGPKRVGLFFRSPSGGGTSPLTCGGIGDINARREKELGHNVALGKTVWRPANDGGGLLAVKMQSTSEMIMTIVGTYFRDTEVMSILITPDDTEKTHEGPVIHLSEKDFRIVTQLPHYMQRDWEENSHKTSGYENMNPLTAMEKGPRLFQPAQITDEVTKILDLYHSE